ncbi:hypothetical protein E2C01_067056 [Portunus trituberculatus]|uniref:Uncharacterized protein n=1 Tax=Portunus trituberculatus TaxID=210409 RepID=A0A5B7HRM6_PORTR|nr:hypothetical protein [Portunus trituberculatus]
MTDSLKHKQTVWHKGARLLKRAKIMPEMLYRTTKQQPNNCKQHSSGNEATWCPSMQSADHTVLRAIC